ncbi:MAG: hypothetical protein JWN45_1857 [Acidobacteriaceae bacterium]|nr:hypothetical protein [Acidobacteriaceae bacterium]
MDAEAEFNLVLGGAGFCNSSSLGGAGLQACIRAAMTRTALAAEVKARFTPRYIHHRPEMLLL